MSLFNRTYGKQLKKQRRLEKRANQLLSKFRKNKKKNKERKSKIIKTFKRPSYKSYIKSKSWLRRRLDYFKKYGKQCIICGDKKVHVHHISYENLGNEKDEDLIMLCDFHHEKFHESVKTKRDLREETYQFIKDEIEANELLVLSKTL